MRNTAPCPRRARPTLGVVRPRHRADVDVPPIGAPAGARWRVRQHAIAAIWTVAAAVVLIVGLALARGVHW